MQTYIAILRGINVGGHNSLPMAGLKALLAKLGHKNIATYIQSGNVVFNANAVNDVAMARTIEAAIQKEFGFEVPVIIRSAAEMRQAVVANPFIGKEGIDVEKLHVTFLEEPPAAANIEKISGYNYPPEQFVIVEKEVYVYCPNGYGNAKLNNSFFESKLKVKATTRNWRTVNKLVEMAGK